MAGFVTFGEIMLRLTPSISGERLLLADNFAVGYAGAESNVASSLACLGNRVDFVSKVPHSPLGQAALQSLNRFGVDTKQVLLGGNRLGTYFIELGKSIRPSRVVYDRQGSSISQITPGEFDWTHILSDKAWLHLSGITPALSDQCAEETILAARVARDLGVRVSFDLNYRRTLWTDSEQARKIFLRIIEHSDLIFANEGALSDVFGLQFNGVDPLERARAAIEKASTDFQVDQLAFTAREHRSASENKVYGLAFSRGKISVSKPYVIQIEDRFGTGDAFAAAYLHAIHKQWSTTQAIEFATAAFALKHTLKGDVHTSTEDEILSTTSGDLSGHVLR